MVESILVLTHADENGMLSQASLEGVTAGKDLSVGLGAPLVIGVVAVNGSLATSLGFGNARVLCVADEALAQSRYASDAAACEALCRAAHASIVIVAAGSRFTRVAAGVAFRLGGLIDTHITSINVSASGEGRSIEVTRSFYRQRIEAVLSRDARPWFLLIDAGTHAAFTGDGPVGEVEDVPVELPSLRTQVLGLRAPQQNALTIRPEAKLLLVAGAGWTKKQADGQTHAAEAGDLILGFLRNTGASLGSSKSLVDQGGDGGPVLPFLTHMNQIGQTGSMPRHAKGLSTCCHGEEPHVVGWRFIADRRAISLDPNCGWARGKADVVYVADAFKVMAKVNEKLAAANEANSAVAAPDRDFQRSQEVDAAVLV